MRRLRVSHLPPLRNAARTHRRIGHWLTLLLFSLALAACSSSTHANVPDQPVIGFAYAGPPSINLRKDLGSKSSVVGSVKHGERLDVLETRRRFVRVRTSAGVEGWVDSTLLLTPQQMDDLHRLADSAAKLPSQGSATPFDTLNIHAEPSRQSPSFFQITESTPVEVIAHQMSPRVSPAPVTATVHHASPARRARGKDPKKLALPPPSPPAPPVHWLDLSRPRESDLPGYQAPEAPHIAYDDWSLIRTKNGNAGWVLSRMLNMSIPDEVAQYAEGHRITSYLALGEVHDKEKNVTKPNWLWTTIGSGQFPYEFDSFRVFVWSLKHHRYETAYIERNVKGYYPVTIQGDSGDDEKSFSVIIEDKDGKLYRRTYAFSGFRCRLVSKAPYTPPAPLPAVHAARDFEAVANPSTPSSARWKEKLAQWRKRLF